MIEHLSNFNSAMPKHEDEDSCASPLRSPDKKGKMKKPKYEDFELQGIVGIGNFGKVHKAYNTKEDRHCALKVLKKESVAEMKHVDHVVNEREVLQYLSEVN